MHLKEFGVERYFAKYEFTAQYLSSNSDCDEYSMSYVLSLASRVEKEHRNNLKLGYTETAGNNNLAFVASLSTHLATIEP